MDIFSNRRLEIADTLLYLFKQLGVKVTYSTISRKLQKHPDFPSAKSISDVLTNVNIRNKATAVDLKTLSDIQVPFLATTFEFETLVITSIKNGIVRFYSSKKGLQTLPLDSFEKIWNGLVILVDTKAKFEEKNYRNIARKELLKLQKKPLAITFLAVLSFLVYYLMPNPVELYFYIFAKIMGVTITLVLLVKSINEKMKIKFCETGDKISCNNVLDSKAANLFGVISMTDIGFVYFSGTFIALLISLIRFSDIIILYLLICLSFLTMLYVPFSIFYQKFIVKKWCVLCLGVLTVIVIENIVSLYLFNSFKTAKILALDSFLLVTISFLIPTILLFFFKQLISNGIKYDLVFFQRSRLLNNYSVFKTIQEKSKSQEMLYNNNDLIIGSEKAEHTLTVVLNPFCSACADEFVLINDLLNKKPESYNAIIRFSKSVLLIDDKNLQAASYLIDLYHNEGKTNFQRILSDWFDIREFKKYAQQYPSSRSALTEKTILNNKEWNKSVTITRTPTLFFDNRKMPEEYSIEDLAYFVF